MRKLLWLIPLLFAGFAYSQNMRSDGVALTQNGVPAPGAQIAVCTQPSVTSTAPCSPLAPLCSSATDASCTSPNPVTADGLGNYFFYVGAGKYTVQFYGPNLVTRVQPDQSISCDLATCNLTGNLIFSGNNSHSGTENFTGLVSFANTLQLNPSYVFAEQFSGSDASCKIAAAITALPSTGGTVDARNLSDSAGLGACSIDPGTKSVSLWLGPYTYHVSQITLRTNLHILGSGSGQGLSSTKQPTVIQAMGNNSTPPFVLSQTASEGQEDIILDGFRIQGTSGNGSQTCISIVSPTLGGLWYSLFSDLLIQNCAGEDLHLEAPNGGGINQFSSFDRVVAYRTNGGGPALHIKGFSNSLDFENSEFDGSVVSQGGDAQTNIVVEDTSGGTFNPYNIMFKLLTCQWAGVCMSVKGADALTVDQPHLEGISGAFLVNSGASFGSFISVHDGWLGNGTGINSGGGYIVDVTASSANASVLFDRNHIFGAPDAIFEGSTNSVSQCQNLIGPEGSYYYLPCTNNTAAVIALATGAIGAHSCTSAQTATVQGVTTGSLLTWNFTTTPIGVTGYGDNTSPQLEIRTWPTANTVNVSVCNVSTGSITPSAISIRVGAWN